jgi:hypothetical protein
MNSSKHKIWFLLRFWNFTARGKTFYSVAFATCIFQFICYNGISLLRLTGNCGAPQWRKGREQADRLGNPLKGCPFLFG